MHKRTVTIIRKPPLPFVLLQKKKKKKKKSYSAATLNCALEDSVVFVFCFVLGEILH